MRIRRASQFLFWLLAAYILFQFFWWAFHIVQLHGEIRQLELVLRGHEADVINSTYLKKVWMIIGEGLVFVSLLLFGLWRMGVYLRKEATLARQERNFMLSITHELKTPVATLRLFLETLRSRKQLTEDQKEKILNDALGETHRLDKLVENILLSTRFENQTDANKQIVDLSGLLREVSAKLHRSIGEKHRLNASIDDGIKVGGDPDLLESLVTNLYDNAVKYSPENSLITVALRRAGGQAILSVADEGGGIPEEEQKKIFKKFYRVGNEETRRSKGTGIGLYIVSQIALIHQGEVNVSSSAGQGARFIVTFPLIS